MQHTHELPPFPFFLWLKLRPAPLAGAPRAGWDAGVALAAALRRWPSPSRDFRVALAVGGPGHAWRLPSDHATAFLVDRVGNAGARRGRPAVAARRRASALAGEGGAASAATPHRQVVAVAVRVAENALRLWPPAAGIIPLTPAAACGRPGRWSASSAVALGAICPRPCL